MKNASDSFARQYLREAAEILALIDANGVDAMALALAKVRDQGGRLFILGSGGGAGHASHAVCDFRKIAQFEAYAPSDNVSELTARANDEGWESIYAAWLKTSRLSATDAILVFSVGGGDRERNISANLVAAMEYARQQGALICALVGRDGGFAALVSRHCVLVPTVEPGRVTPHVESMQALLWHLLVSHPALARAATKWESAAR